MPRPVLPALIILLIANLFWSVAASAADWPQWLGPTRTGTPSAERFDVIDRLPDAGLAPEWRTPQPLTGGWGSPIVSGNRVFLFTYQSRPRAGVSLGEPEYPDLTAEKKAGMSPQELSRYDADQAREAAVRARASTLFEDRLHCLDLRTGKPLWETHWEGRYVRWGQSSTPTADNGVLYVVGSDRQVHAIAEESGAVVWVTRQPAPELDEPVSSSVAISEGKGIVLVDTLRAFDLKTGELAWNAGENCPGVHASPSLWRGEEGPVAVVNIKGAKTVGIRVSDGRELWRLDTGAENSTPVISGDRMITYGNSRKGGVGCYELGETPKKLWSYHRAADPGASPSVSGGTVVVAGDATLTCLDLETGKPIRSDRLDLAKSEFSSPLIVGDRVIFADQGLWIVRPTAERSDRAMEARFNAAGVMATPEQHREWMGLSKLNPAEREAAWKAEVIDRGLVECTSPALAGGRLILRLKTGLACYRIASPVAAVVEGN